MNKEDIKRVVEKIEPDNGMKYRLAEKISRGRGKKLILKPMTAIYATMFLVISLAIFGQGLLGDVSFGSLYGSHLSKDKISNKSYEGVFIPKIELPKKTTGQMDMIGLIVYQGRIYTQTDSRINPEDAGMLLGEKLGTTKGNIDEWSKQKDYAVEFASTIGTQDVYSVKGYDKSFRIMTYGNYDGVPYAEFYECMNGITVKTGEDLFNKLKLEGNIKSAKYEEFDSWNHNKEKYKELKELSGINSFVNELKNTKPHSQKSLTYLFNNEGNQKFIHLTLNDGCQVQLRLFKEGYVFYCNAHTFFEMDKGVLDSLWNELE